MEKYELEQTLQPDEQMWVDVGTLIREQAPDKNGKTLPSDLTMGSYEFRDLTNKGIGTLFEGKVIYDRTYGHVTYGCAVCCGYTRALLTTNPLDIPTGSFIGNGVTGTDSCGNVDIAVDSYFYNNWKTDDPSIATVDGHAVHTGVAAGLTVSRTNGLLQSPGGRVNGLCPIKSFSPIGGDGVQPTISGPSTLWWFNGLSAGVSGYSNQITLTANSGGNSTTYQWAITAGSSKVSLSTSTSATVQVTSIGQSTTANDVSITVTVGGQTSNPFKLTVHAPYALGQDPNPAHTTPVYADDPQYVWNISIYYQILDNLLTPMPTPVSVNEDWTTAGGS